MIDEVGTKEWAQRYEYGETGVSVLASMRAACLKWFNESYGPVDLSGLEPPRHAGAEDLPVTLANQADRTEDAAAPAI